MVKCIACGSENVRKTLRYRCENCGKISTKEELSPIIDTPDTEELDWDEEDSACDEAGNLYFLDNEGNIHPSKVASCCPVCFSDKLTLWGLYECSSCGKKFDEGDLFHYFKEKYCPATPSQPSAP